TKLEHVAARRDMLMKVDPIDPIDLPMSELLEDHLLDALRVQYIEGKKTLEQLQANGKGEGHPDVKAATAVLKTTRDSRLSEVKSVEGGIDADYRALKSEEIGLSNLFETAKKRAMDLNLSEIEYKRLLRTKNNTEKLYSLVLDRTKESELTGLMKFNNIRVI